MKGGGKEGVGGGGKGRGGQFDQKKQPLKSLALLGLKRTPQHRWFLVIILHTFKFNVCLLNKTYATKLF